MVRGGDQGHTTSGSIHECPLPILLVLLMLVLIVTQQLLQLLFEGHKIRALVGAPLEAEPEDVDPVLGISEFGTAKLPAYLFVAGPVHAIVAAVRVDKQRGAEHGESKAEDIGLGDCLGVGLACPFRSERLHCAENGDGPGDFRVTDFNEAVLGHEDR
jgi:hypothetical protein